MHECEQQEINTFVLTVNESREVHFQSIKSMSRQLQKQTTKKKQCEQINYNHRIDWRVFRV